MLTIMRRCVTRKTQVCSFMVKVTEVKCQKYGLLWILKFLGRKAYYYEKMCHEQDPGLQFKVKVMLRGQR